MININRYTIQRNLPTILTVTACTGVIGTELLSMRAGYRYKELTDMGEPPLTTALKEGILPTIVAGISIASFIFARRADKAMIAGLSLAATSGLNRAVEEHRNNSKTSANIIAPQGTIIVDEDGELYYEPIGDVFIQMTQANYENGMKRFNKNYAIRGIASVYEMYRMFGVTKRDITEHTLDWLRYVGWHVTPMFEGKGFAWVDDYAVKSKDGTHRVISINDDILPICCDAPDWILDKCHVDREDICSYDFELPEASEIEYQIANDICDGDVE